jgi:fido (protein-threonine AMPylation protein)
MHPHDCPSWEYDSIAGAREIIRERAIRLLLRLRATTDECSAVASETRNSHAELFAQLTPSKHDYYAGHFRGEAYRCLLHYRVQVASDPLVGTNPEDVIGEMTQLNTYVIEAISALDAFVSTGRSRVAKLIRVVQVAARVFVQFLTIHPYANGNGHAGRLIVCALLGRYGFWMKRWDVEPRPVDPPYTQAIADLSLTIAEDTLARWRGSSSSVPSGGSAISTIRG